MGKVVMRNIWLHQSRHLTYHPPRYWEKFRLSQQTWIWKTIKSHLVTIK